MAAVRPGTPFIGRARELARLRSLLEGAAAGTSAAVLLAGDAGVGKTSLAAEFARQARAEGALVVLGRNVELGTGGLPYLPFAEILTTLARGHDPDPVARAAYDVVREILGRRPVLARLTGAHTAPLPLDADLDRLALFETVADTLAELAAHVAPLVVVLEDLHWAEQSTRDLLRFLLTRLGPDRLLVVGTYRAEDVHRRHPARALLAELLRLPAVELMELAPFADGELADFLSAVQGSQVPADVVERIGRRSGGNAYFAEELLDAGSVDNLPTVLADVLLDRLERLPATARQLVRVAAVIGNFRIDDALLRAAAASADAMSSGDIDAGLRDALAHHVLVPDGPDRFGFRHALLQEAVYSDLLPGERVRLHAAMASLSTDAAEQARHSLAAHDLPSALSAALRAAVDAAARLAPGEALEQYDVVLELWPAVRPAADLVDVTLAAAGAASDAGFRDRAVALAGAAVEAARSGGDPERLRFAQVRRAIHLTTLDRIDEATELAQAVVDAFPGTADGGACDSPTAALVAARALVARNWRSLSEPERSLTVVRPGLAEARLLGDRSAEADLLLTLAQVEAMLGNPGSERYFDQARQAAEAAGDRATQLRVAYSIVVDRFEEGQFEGALAAIDEALEDALRSGLISGPYAVQCRWMRVHAYWMLGRPDEALGAIERARGVLPPIAMRELQHAALGVLAARSPSAAQELADELDRTNDNPLNRPARWAARGEALAWTGDFRRAAECAGRALDELDAQTEPYQLVGISYSTNAVAALADLASARRSLGDLSGVAAAEAAAARFVADARERADKGRPRRFRMGPEGQAWLVRLDAESARLTGTDTAAQWSAVVSAFSFGMVYETARGLWRLASRLVADGSRDLAVEPFARARSMAAGLGAVPLLAALDDLGRRGRLVNAVPGPAGARLTARERDVMRLVAQGLTNRAIGDKLFISEKTASVHVSNVLTKLDANGRTEAVAIATRDGLLD